MQRQNPQTTAIATMDVVDEPSQENPKIISEINLEEPLLGSITTSSTLRDDKGILIRSSARVFKKMKLEQEQDKKNEEANQHDSTMSSPNADHSVLLPNGTEKLNENEGKSTGKTTNRVIKKNNSDSKSKKDESKNEIKKEPRKWGFWDKMVFFEAVNEFGKDFESIQHYINQKLKKKGMTEDQMRTKDHVRQFFIRTFHEVSKHVKFAEGVKKMIQELYGVINYGEMYRKLGVMTDKSIMKLYELIYRGETCLRIKGKNIRIKTPMCRALVNLNQLDQKYEEVKLPNRVTVELRPKDMTSYLKIQCIAQNPRLRTSLPIQKRLSALIQCLNKRWKTVEAVNYEKALESTNPLTDDCVPDKEVIEKKFSLVIPPLRLSPPVEAKVEIPSINLSEYFTRQTICLTAFENRLGLNTFIEIKKAMSRKKKNKLEVEPVAAGNIKVEPNNDAKVETIIIEPANTETEKLDDTIVEKSIYYPSEADASLADAVHQAVNTILSLQTRERQKSETGTEAEAVIVEPVQKMEICSKVESSIKMELSTKVSQEDLDHIEKIRKGWTEATCGSLTIGEIYLMYGSDAKLILEFSWDGDVNEDAEKRAKSSANFLEMWNESYLESSEIRQKNITTSLTKLLSLAKLDYIKNNTKVKCSCGHVCGDKQTRSFLGGGPRMRKNTIMENLQLNQNDEIAGKNSNGTSNLNDSVFRSPNLPSENTPTMEEQLNSIQKLKPKFLNKKGRRFGHKPLVVERKLPVLPNNVSGHQIVRMNIISQETPSTSTSTSSSSKVAPSHTETLQSNNKNEPCLQEVITDPEEENSGISTIPSSPSRILKDGEGDWINSEVADYSLSSLLGHLESPMKTSNNQIMPLNSGLNSNMASDLSCEVDAQLQSLMTESSMDFTASFADLAASVVNDRKF